MIKTAIVWLLLTVNPPPSSGYHVVAQFTERSYCEEVKRNLTTLASSLRCVATTVIVEKE